MRVLTAEEADILQGMADADPNNDEDWEDFDERDFVVMPSMRDVGWVVDRCDDWYITDRGRLALRAHAAWIATMGGSQ